MEPVPLLDLKAQYEPLREEIARTLEEIVESQMFVLGPPVEQLEQEVAAYVGAAHAVGCASGTDALILAIAALEMKPDEQVLTSPFSFFSSASCAHRAGVRPAFADIDPETFNLDPESVEAAITPRTTTMLPVHLFGQCAAMDPLLAIGRRHGVTVIEDAAQSLGATYESAVSGKKFSGTLGRAGCYSFFPTKNLGCFGDGGMIVTDDDALAEHLRLLRVHGGRQMYHHRYVGWNSRLDALQAAVLRVKLPHLNDWSRGRTANADRYDDWFRESGLTESGKLRVPHRSPESSHIFNQYTVRVERRDELREHLKRSGIGHSVYYPVPLHLQECFRDLGYSEGDFPVAEQACREVLALPIYPELRDDQQRRVVDAIIEFYR